MNIAKASRTSGVLLEMLFASGDIGIKQMIHLFKIIVGNNVEKDWDTSVIVNCYKNKGGATEWGNYRGLKLLLHMKKVFEELTNKKSE